MLVEKGTAIRSLTSERDALLKQLEARDGTDTEARNEGVLVGRAEGTAAAARVRAAAERSAWLASSYRKKAEAERQREADAWGERLAAVEARADSAEAQAREAAVRLRDLLAEKEDIESQLLAMHVEAAELRDAAVAAPSPSLADDARAEALAKEMRLQAEWNADREELMAAHAEAQSVLQVRRGSRDAP